MNSKPTFLRKNDKNKGKFDGIFRNVLFGFFINKIIFIFIISGISTKSYRHLCPSLVPMGKINVFLLYIFGGLLMS